jgi:hypothetical protein
VRQRIIFKIKAQLQAVVKGMQAQVVAKHSSKRKESLDEGIVNSKKNKKAKLVIDKGPVSQNWLQLSKVS